MTIEQIKALAFDQVVAKEQAQNNLNALLAELQKRNAPAPFVPAAPETPATPETPAIEGNNAE